MKKIYCWEKNKGQVSIVTLNKMSVCATWDSKLEAQRSVIKFLLLEGG